MVFGMGFAATSLGVARATLDAAIDLARAKTPQAQKAMRENNAVQGVIGRTEAQLRATRAYLYSTAAEVWRDLSHGVAITEAHRIALRIAATWTIHQSAAVVDTAYHMAGATAVFNRQQVRTPLSRHACDRATDPGPRFALRRRRQGDPVSQSRYAADGAIIPFRNSTDRPATPVVKQFMKSLTEPSPLELPYVPCSKFVRSPFA